MQPSRLPNNQLELGLVKSLGAGIYETLLNTCTKVLPHTAQAKFNDVRTGAIIKNLGDPDPQARLLGAHRLLNAISVLAKSPDDNPALEALLHRIKVGVLFEPSLHIARSVVQALAPSSNPKIAQFLFQIANNKELDGSLREAAIYSLGTDVSPFSSELLAMLARSEISKHVRRELEGSFQNNILYIAPLVALKSRLQSPVSIGDKAEDLLLKTWKELIHSDFAKYGVATEQMAAILIGIKNPKAIAALKESLLDDKTPHVIAQEIMNEVILSPHPRLVGAIEELSDGDIRSEKTKQAVLALDRIRSGRKEQMVLIIGPERD